MVTQGIDQMDITIETALRLSDREVISPRLADYCIQMAILEEGKSDNESVNRVVARAQVDAVTSRYGSNHELTKHTENRARVMAGLY